MGAESALSVLSSFELFNTVAVRSGQSVRTRP
jgi:hypothetical protein